MNKFYLIEILSLLFLFIILFIIYQNNFKEYFISQILKDIQINTEKEINENNKKIKEILTNN
jgi:hypothetical protein